MIMNRLLFKNVIVASSHMGCCVVLQLKTGVIGMMKLRAFRRRDWQRAFAAAFFIATAAVSPVSAQPVTQGVTDNEILIGAVGPLSGATAFIGAPARDGIQLAVTQINNSGGINGRKVKLLFEHAFSPAETIAAAKKLVESDKVFVLLLAAGSTGSAAAADYVREAKIPTYNMIGATWNIRRPFAQNIYHSAVPDTRTSSRKIIERTFTNGKPPKKIGVLSGAYAFPQANFEEIIPLLTEMKIDYAVEHFEQGSRDFTAQLISLARQRVDAVIVLGNFSEAGFAIKQAPEKGLIVSRWVLDGSAVNNAIIPIIGKTEGVVGYYLMPFFPDQDAESPKRFIALWKSVLGDPPQGRPNIYDLIGYGSTYVLAQALQKAGRDLSWEALMITWSNLQNAKPSNMGGIDITFPESFTPTDHQGNKQMSDAVIRNGKWIVE
jgi:branched-chain amino acid transport system substrate-binding protein